MKEPAVTQIVNDIMSVNGKIRDFFKGDEGKMTEWLNTANPLLEGQEPIEMIFMGRTEELNRFIEDSLNEI